VVTNDTNICESCQMRNMPKFYIICSIPNPTRDVSNDLKTKRTNNSSQKYTLIIYMINLYILLIILVFICIFSAIYYEFIYDKPYDWHKTEFPFKNLRSQDGTVLKIIALTAPFRSDEHKKQYHSMKQQGCLFIGVSSYLEFPGKIINPHDDQYYNQSHDDYYTLTSAWLHCFRHPNNYIPKYIPKMLLSESDFANSDVLKPEVPPQKDYDIIYLCLNDSDTECIEGWQAYNRNWTLAKKCFSLLCQQMDLKILIVGRTKCTVDKCSSNITTIDFLPYWDFVNKIKKARILFVPNVSDASPRVVTESLCCDLRILMNYDIVGGWKYVNQFTGEYFHDEHDFIDKLRVLLNKYDSYKPREWFVENYGTKNSGKKLLGFLKDNYKINWDGVELVTF